MKNSFTAAVASIALSSVAFAQVPITNVITNAFDFGADAAGIAHGDGQQRRRGSHRPIVGRNAAAPGLCAASGVQVAAGPADRLMTV